MGVILKICAHMGRVGLHMLVCSKFAFLGNSDSILVHLSSNWAQKRLPGLNVRLGGGLCAKKKTGSRSDGIRIFPQISFEQ